MNSKKNLEEAEFELKKDGEFYSTCKTCRVKNNKEFRM